MRLDCTICGKPCIVRPARVKKGITHIETFKCKPCNLRYHNRTQTTQSTWHRQYLKALTNKDIEQIENLRKEKNIG